MESLTRITILLAKVTIPFLPVSLATAIFSIPTDGMLGADRVGSYSITVAIVLLMSFLGLVLFGRLSGTQEGKTIYRSLTRSALESWKRTVSRKKNEMAEAEE